MRSHMKLLQQNMVRCKCSINVDQFSYYLLYLPHRAVVRMKRGVMLGKCLLRCEMGSRHFAFLQMWSSQRTRQTLVLSPRKDLRILTFTYWSSYAEEEMSPWFTGNQQNTGSFLGGGLISIKWSNSSIVPLGSCLGPGRNLMFRKRFWRKDGVKGTCPLYVHVGLF